MLDDVRFDAASRQFRGTARYNGRPVVIWLDAQPDVRIVDARATMEAAIADVATNAVSIVDRCADELLETHNEHWAASADDVVDRLSFGIRLKLRTIRILREGGIDLFYDDDGMFRGHTVTVYADADLNVTDVLLEG